MKRLISVLLTIALFVTLFCACTVKDADKPNSADTTAKASTADEKINIATLKGPTGMGMAYMIDENDGKYNFEVCSSPDEITSRIVSGALDIAALPTNAAATLYNKSNGKVKLLALNTECVLYVLEKGNTIKSIKDLSGKTVYVSGQGSTPQYIIEYLLEANGVKNVNLDYTYVNHADLVAFAASGKADAVLLPEPTVTALLAKNSDFRVALDIDDIWEDTVGEDKDITMGCVVVNMDFAEKNKEAVKTFLKEYESSINRIDEDDLVDASSAVIEKVGIVEKAAVAKMALDRCNITFEAGNDMKEDVEPFLSVLFKAEPNSIGGKMPDANFYYIAK